jgi:hypothetical protein
MRILAHLLGLQLLSAAITAQDLQVPYPEALRMAATIAAEPANLAGTSIPTDPNLAQVQALREGQRGLLVLPETRLDAANIVAVAPGTTLAVGQLWLRQLDLLVDGQPLPDEAFHLIEIGTGGERVTLRRCALGVRRGAGPGLELLVFGRTAEPLLAVPVTESVQSQDRPITLGIEPTGGDGGLLRLHLTGRFTANLPLTRATGGQAADGRALLAKAMAPELLPMAGFEVASRESIRRPADGEGVSLGIIPGQRRVNSGTRAEIAVDYPFVEGDTVRYAWRFRLPTGTASDAPKNRWWLMGQWHVQPDKRSGETTWEARHALSPPVMLGYGVLDGQDALVLSYGVEAKPVLPMIPFARGVWHRIEAEITWSRGAAGRATILLNGTQVAVASGPNMQNAYQHYLKIGQYRHPEIAGESWIDLAGLEIRTVR